LRVEPFFRDKGKESAGVTHKRLTVAFIGLVALVALDAATAAEIRGRLWETGKGSVPSGTTVQVRCGSSHPGSPVPVSKNGS
jgi:hypothetical protein